MLADQAVATQGDGGVVGEGGFVFDDENLRRHNFHGFLGRTGANWALFWQIPEVTKLVA